MDSWHPQSPDLSSSYAPRSPDLGGVGLPASPNLQGLGSPRFGNNNLNSHFNNRLHHQQNGFIGGYQPTSVPQEGFYPEQYHDNAAMPPRQVKSEDDDDYMPDAPPTKRSSRRVKQEPSDVSNGMLPEPANFAPVAQPSSDDPTLGCTLNTSFPVARIKRIMQADEDIGKVAQVTPHVVSRALELFMIKIISAAAQEARGPPGSGGSSKGPKRVLGQHLKKVVLADKKCDFLEDIVTKVPDAPTKSKKENASDSEDAKPKKKSKKRKDSGDDI